MVNILVFIPFLAFNIDPLATINFSQTNNLILALINYIVTY
jgi:hypothetical protein